MRSYFFLLSVLLCLMASSVMGQEQEDDVPVYKVTLVDGNVFIGYMLDRTPEGLTLITEQYGELYFTSDEIRSVERVLQGPNQEQPTINRPEERRKPVRFPQEGRYVIQSSGYGLKKGEGYYQNYWIFINQANVGITDNISMGVGTVPLFMFGNIPSPVWITPKVSLPIVKDRFQLGVGALIGRVVGAEGSGFGMLYGTATIGSRDRNFSIGLGFPYESGWQADLPLLSVSGIYKIGGRSYLLTENYIDIGNTGLNLLSFGGRQMIRRVGLDYGAFIPFFEGGGLPIFTIPWLGVSIPFGRRY